MKNGTLHSVHIQRQMRDACGQEDEGALGEQMTLPLYPYLHLTA